MAITKLEITGNTTAIGITQVPIVVSAANEASATTIDPITGIIGSTVQNALAHLESNKAETHDPVIDEPTLNGHTIAREIAVETTTGDIPYVLIGSQNNTAARFELLKQTASNQDFDNANTKGVRFELNALTDQLDIKCRSATHTRDVMYIDFDGNVHFKNNAPNQTYGFSYYGEPNNPRVVIDVPTEINGDITNTGTLGAPYGITTDFVNLGDQSLTTFKQGTWTPSIQDITFSVRHADYMQIGNMVTLSLSIYDVDTSNISESSGAQFYITGLPVNPRSGTDNAQLSNACHFDFHNLDDDKTMHTEVVYPSPSAARINIVHGHDKTAVTHLDIPNTVTTGYLNLQVTYFV